MVTGASSGIGEAACVRLIDEGAFVIASGRNIECLKALQLKVSHPNMLAIEVNDITQDTFNLNKWVRGIAKKYGKLSGAVLSAGIQDIAPLRAVTEEGLHKLFQVNFEANFWIAKGFCDKRVNIGTGSSLVFISSISSVVGEAGLSAYSATKGALNSFMRSLAKEVSSQGLRVNAILPGLVKTQLLEKFDDFYTKEYLQEISKNYPLGIGSPEDVSGVISFLMSEDSKWITGTCIKVDGGATL
ncbi:MAG: SDR family NAD(P)-dependent oxidoreductase [Emcibacteraceae bacterium]|nr:SDR family NAD(P)-dependent oxidoreductase [Emcibacteraceae bacterium]